jgi:hypothetical protein
MIFSKKENNEKLKRLEESIVHMDIFLLVINIVRLARLPRHSVYFAPYAFA